MQDLSTEISYQSIRDRSLRSASTVRVLGVPIGDRSDDYVTILWCGIGIDGQEHREPSERIWHLTKSDVVASGQLDDFKAGGAAVHWFDMRKDTSAVEESYTPVSVIHLARLRIGGGRFGRFPGGFEIPVTLEPTSTTIPSSPPVTISP